MRKGLGTVGYTQLYFLILQLKPSKPGEDRRAAGASESRVSNLYLNKSKSKIFISIFQARISNTVKRRAQADQLIQEVRNRITRCEAVQNAHASQQLCRIKNVSI